jgi:trypsin
LFGRGLASLVAVAAMLAVGPSVASGQENPVLDLESAVPVIPYSVSQQLAAAPGRLPSVGPGPDHPWAPSGAPFPLNVTYVTGSYRNANGSTTIVYCALDVAAEHPYWYQENMIRTWAVGGARCNVRLAEEAGGGMTGTVRARGFPTGSQLASATLGSQHQVPEGQGSGWQAYGIAEYDRASTNSNQQVQLEATLVLPAWAGMTNIGWNTLGPGCTRGSNNREVNCQFSSPPFQTLPYPCPDSPFQGGKLGFQPGACYDQPQACDIVSGRYGIEPNCTSTAPETVIEEGPPPVTKSTSATFKFRSDQPFATFECQLDSGSWAACSSPKAYTGLADGTHVFQVRARNAIGQADQSPASHTWRVDTVPPDTTITSAPPQFSNSPAAEFAFSANEADVSFECQLDSAAWEPCASPKRYVELAETAHTFRVRGTDPAGNLEPTPATYTWTVDLTPPETTITGGPSGTVWSQSASFSFTSSEAGSFECRLDGAAFSVCSTPKAYSGLSEGSHTFDVRAVDRAGNRDGSPARRSWTVTLRPSIVLSGSFKDAADAGSVLAESNYDLVVTANDESSGVTNIEVSVDGVLQDFLDRPCPTGGCSLQSSWTFPTGDFPGGQHVVQVTARNGGGLARSTSISVTTNPDNDEDGPEGAAGGGGGGGGGPEADDALEPEARSRWPDTFAGLWQAVEGQVFVAFTENANENVAQLRQDFPGAGDLVPVTLPRPLAELEALQDQMIADRATPPTDGLLPLPDHYDLDIDVIQNSVYAVVDDVDPRARLAFASRYGPTVQVRQGPLFEPERCTRANCKYQLRAGLVIQRAIPGGFQKWCSSGFVVRTGAGNLNLLSAGHCSAIGDSRYHGGELYGTVRDRQQRNRVDAERQSIDGAFTGAGVMFVDSDERARPVQTVSRWDDVRLERRICKTGWKTGKTCGTVKSKHFSPDDEWVPSGNRFIRTTYCAEGGDSGAAVFRGNRAFGVHSGGESGKCHPGPDNDFSAFSHIEYIENALNVSVVTTP